MNRRRQLADALADAEFDLKDKLVAARKMMGLSQETVGARLGITKQAVSCFERLDSNPTLSTIRNYAYAIGVLVTYNVGQLPDVPVRSAAEFQPAPLLGDCVKCGRTEAICRERAAYFVTCCPDCEHAEVNE